MKPSAHSQPLRRRGIVFYGVAALAACSPEPAPTAAGAPAAGADRGIPEEAVASAAGRPNVVVIMSDDQTTEEIRVMPKTRSMIGAAGVTFRNNVVTYALCCPSRATFLTGQYPHNHGVRSNALPDGGYTRLDHTNTLPRWLQEAGYVTGHIGKYLNGYGEVDTLTIPPGYTEWYGSVGGLAYRYYNYKVNENGTLVSYGSNAGQYQSDVYTAKALSFIRRRGPVAAAGGKPFFLFVTYLAPHWGGPTEPGDPSLETPVPAPRHKGRFAGELLPKSPAFNEADMTDKPASLRTRAMLTATQVREVGEAYRQRLESLLAVDEGVGRIIDALQDAGVLQNTLVIYTSDNGWFQGEHRVGFGKILPYEPAVKVPLLARGPGVVPGRQVSAPVANIDLAPTIVTAAGGRARRTMDGRSLWPLLQGQTTWPTVNGPRHVLVEDSPSGRAASVFWSIRRGKYVYTEYANGDRELYDLGIDSAQVASRHANAAYASIRRGLASRLAAMKTCSGPTACW
jgi:N-acetylglucosamine-6-sulfatase